MIYIDLLGENAELEDVIKKVNELIELRNKTIDDKIKELESQNLFLRSQCENMQNML